jgi:hypothetical protein
MPLFSVILNNLFAIPIFLFLAGFILSFFNISLLLKEKHQTLLIYFLLFCIGVKGGSSFRGSVFLDFFYLLALLVAWGFLQPFLSLAILRKFTKIDLSTAAVIASCFGSVSLVTFAAATAFLEKLNICYESLVISLLAIMEIPAIFSGLIICRWKNLSNAAEGKGIIWHTLFNKSIALIIFGLLFGFLLSFFDLHQTSFFFKQLFNPSLYVFLLNMGFLIGRKRKDLTDFSFSLCLFGCYMPLLGGGVGLLLSYIFQTGVGTGTLISVLTASASYIAVPAAMKIAIPQARESIYLPLSLMIAFPFNILIGIPIYYLLAAKFLS